MAGTAFEPEELRLFHKACREGRTRDIAKSKISSKMLDTRSVVTGRTALHEACANGHRDTVEQLLKLGMLDTHKGTYLGGDTPLHLAVSSGERSLVFLLLRHRCDPNLPNKFGATCFHYADRQPAIAKLLLRYGGKVSIRDRSGKTPWDYFHEGCPGNRVMNNMMKEAYNVEERKRVQDAYALVKQEEDHANAKREAENALKESEKAGKAALDYKSWRGGAGQRSAPPRDRP